MECYSPSGVWACFLFVCFCIRDELKLKTLIQISNTLTPGIVWMWSFYLAQHKDGPFAKFGSTFGI